MARASAKKGGEVTNLGVLILRLVLGGLLAGHGAQKLFGHFNGPGLEGTSGWSPLACVRGVPGPCWRGSPSSAAACPRFWGSSTP